MILAHLSCRVLILISLILDYVWYMIRKEISKVRYTSRNRGLENMTRGRILTIDVRAEGSEKILVGGGKGDMLHRRRASDPKG